MKKIKTLLLAGVVLGIQGATIAPVQAQEFSHYLVEEKTLPVDEVTVSMYYDSGRTMVELNDVAKATETEAIYNYPNITINADILTIDLEIGSNNCYVNGSLMTLPVAPTLKDTHVFLPLFDIAQILGLDWYQDDNGIKVSGKKLDIYSTIDVYGKEIITGTKKTSHTDMTSIPFYNTNKSETMINYKDFAVATNTEIDYNHDDAPWITITDGKNIFDLTVGDTLCKVNQRDSYRLLTAPTIKDGQLYLPTKEVAKLLGFNVNIKDDLIILFK